MQKVNAGPRVSFELMVGNQQKETFSLFKCGILRTVAAASLPSRVINLRNALIIVSTILLGIDAFDSWLYAKDYQWA